MFILHAIPLGIVAGLLTGGRLDRLADVRFRWGWLVFVGLLVQVVLFAGPVARAIGDAGPAVYVASTAAVLVAVIRNARIPGLAVVVAGAAANLIAILANGGVMPVSPEAIAGLGPTGEGFSNSVVKADAVLRPLTDVFALPGWIPLANVFSVGDVLIGVGVTLVIALGMRGDATSRDRFGTSV